MKKTLSILACIVALASCKMSYQFNGASIDYNLVKTINITYFPNQATTVYPPLSQVFTETLQDYFTRNSKLNFTTDNPDLEIEGEIIRYDFTAQSVSEMSDNRVYASETRLTLTVKFRYINNKNPQENKEETITAYRDFSSNKMVTDVQDQLIDELSKDISEQIFNATLSNW